MCPGQILRVRSGGEKLQPKAQESPAQVETILCEIWKQEVAYCTRVSEVRGLLTLTNYFLMFDPALERGKATLWRAGKQEEVPVEQCLCYINLQDVRECVSLRLPARKVGQSLQVVMRITLATGLSADRDINGSAQFSFRIKSPSSDTKLSWQAKLLVAQELVAKITQYRQLCQEETHTANTVLPLYDVLLPLEDCDEEIPDKEDSASSVPESASPTLYSGRVRFVEVVDSLILDAEKQEQLARELPKLYQLRRWQLAYSPSQHGCSLRTLYRNACEYGATLLVVQDEGRVLFGGFITEPLRVTKRFYGTGEGFLFRFCPNGELKVYRPSFLNEYYIISDLEAIILGSGGSPGLYLAADLLTGCSAYCDTYENEVLASCENFKVLNLELWGFA